VLLYKQPKRRLVIHDFNQILQCMDLLLFHFLSPGFHALGPYMSLVAGGGVNIYYIITPHSLSFIHSSAHLFINLFIHPSPIPCNYSN
jgi:hypothetical protein